MAEKKSKNLHDGHRDRVRDKFRKSEFNNMNSHEVLEMLLFHSVPRKDTNELAHALINHFGSLPSVLEASEEELCKVPGVSRNSAVLIRMILPLYRVYSKERAKNLKINNAEECGNFLVEYFAGCDKEKVAIVCFDSVNRVIGVEDICDGDAFNVIVNLRKIIEVVMRNAKTTAVILTHNHPNGIAIPSREDIDSTKEIRKTLGTMGISVVDHIIVVEGDYVSMSNSPGYAHIFK